MSDRSPAIGEAAARWAVSRHARVGPRAVRYREAGKGPVIVLVHGLGVSADYWVRTGPVLAAGGFRVLAPDLPGFGRTPGTRDGLGIRAQADALRAWALALDLPPAIFVGHSLSCQTVIEMAARYPDAATALALVAPTGGGSAVPRLVRQSIGLLRDIRRESFALAALVAQAYLRAGPAKVIRTWRMGAGHDPIAIAPSVRVPTIIIVGEKDPLVDREFIERLSTALPHSRGVVTIPEAAHAVIFEETGAFNQALLAFARTSDRERQS